jgi:hypothetical protein
MSSTLILLLQGGAGAIVLQAASTGIGLVHADILIITSINVMPLSPPQETYTPVYIIEIHLPSGLMVFSTTVVDLRTAVEDPTDT